MIRTNHQSRVGAKKSYTSYKWTLDDWRLLCSHHYSNGITSPEFFLSDTRCECSMTLLENGRPWRLIIHCSKEINCLLMEIIVSFVDKEMNKHQFISTFKKPFPADFNLSLVGLITKDYNFLTKDALVLLVEFTIVKSIGNSELQTESFSENSTKNVRGNLQEILNSKSFCDLTFVIGEKEFVAHKVILAANSEVFRAMFITKMKEEEINVVKIDDIDATVFEEFLKYMYSGKINNLENIVSELIIVAEKYLMDDLKQLCSNYMSAHIDIENAIQYLLVFHKLDCDGPKMKALNFIKANPHVLANTADYKILCDYPELIKEVFGTNSLSML